MLSRKQLSVARSSKKDEFYTLYEDVKFELDHYLDQFKDKVVYCPCDTKDSAFVKYFLELETKGLIKELLYTSLKDGVDCLGDGAIDGYNHCDIVVTNPPFSLFRPFLALLDKLGKKFIIWGTNNAIMYKVTSALLAHDKIRLGHIANRTCEFSVPRDYADADNSKVYTRDGCSFVKVPSVTTFTNMNVEHNSFIALTKHFDDTYVKYDNFNAINCNKVTDIPIDYNGYIGVPITYLTKHDPSKFKIVGVFNNYDEMNIELGRITGDQMLLDKPPWKTRGPVIDGKPLYARIIIQHV